MNKLDRVLEAYADRCQEAGHDFQYQMLFGFSEHHLSLRKPEDCCWALPRGGSCQHCGFTLSFAVLHPPYHPTRLPLLLTAPGLQTGHGSTAYPRTQSRNQRGSTSTETRNSQVLADSSTSFIHCLSLQERMDIWGTLKACPYFCATQTLTRGFSEQLMEH